MCSFSDAGNMASAPAVFSETTHDADPPLAEGADEPEEGQRVWECPGCLSFNFGE